MIVRDIKALLKERGPLSWRELAVHFDMAPSAIEPILQKLLTKEQIELLPGCGLSCSGCTAACREDVTIYKLKQ